MNNLTICQNCGGEEGLHEYETLRCPRNGQESPIGRKQLWQDTFWLLPDHKVDDLKSTIASMEHDAIDNTFTIRNLLEVNAAQAAEIKMLKAQIAELTKCKHPHIKVNSKLYAAETHDMPAEYSERAECKDCGEWMDVNDIPEDSEVSE